MNSILNGISWTLYFTTCFIAALAGYAFIAWKYYRTEIRDILNRLSGKTDRAGELPAALQYQPEEQLPTEKSGTTDNTQEAIAEEEFKGPVRSLAVRLHACIDEASDEAFAPAMLIPKLKKLLNDYPDVAFTPEREKINALIAGECERTGTALLSESEVDTWWSA
ncbi:hypothetical protein D0C36_15760 [Mucilaginibacter conchicola]|uniref:Uncharacterized protein n=1 Tax=Mucilaginibacter conchicola TaxID=2303333 RepID=A0A372NUD4_9SPHI|nr:hypothetical protein [Mucilaginibacter conchicola]RFZ92846.1 hypothetical protein D0C36_15760 [Mucilaginibacter conchicola]